MFTRRDRETGEEEEMSVAHFFQVIKQQPLRFPRLQCVLVRSYAFRGIPPMLMVK
jgi:hypothetical protein